jgi:hypothetical protein
VRLIHDAPGVIVNMTSRIDAWLAAAVADAEGRGLPELKPMLEALARATESLRSADEQLRLRAQPSRPQNSSEA